MSAWYGVKLAENMAAQDKIVESREAAIAYLTHDGNFAVPCSRYGRDSESCAPVAWRAAQIVADETGDVVRVRDLDYAMGLVVNDADDIANLLAEHGE